MHSEPVQPSERFAAPQPTPIQSRTQRRNERARQHQIDQLRELREFREGQHKLAVERQAEWSAEEAWRDPREFMPCVWCASDGEVIERKTEALRNVEADARETRAELVKRRPHGPFVRISPVFNETRLARPKRSKGDTSQ